MRRAQEIPDRSEASTAIEESVVGGAGGGQAAGAASARDRPSPFTSNADPLGPFSAPAGRSTPSIRAAGNDNAGVMPAAG